MRRILAILVTGMVTIAIGAAPATAAARAPGDVVPAVPVTLPPELATRATAVRVEYRTTDPAGAAITATGLLLTPLRNRVPKTVVWAHGSTGLADRCAPSQNAGVFWPEARQAVAELLRRGWTVAAPDYPGLGTPAPHPYLVGDSEGRAVIDIVKAARNLDRGLGYAYAIDGHSQGGQAALFAGELAPSYDGPLVLRGVAAIAPASNVDLLAPVIPDTEGKGYLVMGVLGLAAVDPSVNPAALFAPPAKTQDKRDALERGCLYEILAAFAGLSRTDFLVGGNLPDAVVAKLARRDNPAQRPSSAPILVVQGTADEAVPADVTGLLVEQLRAYPQPVEVVMLEGATHDEAVFDTTTLVADWIAARLG